VVQLSCGISPNQLPFWGVAKAFRITRSAIYKAVPCSIGGRHPPKNGTFLRWILEYAMSQSGCIGMLSII
jgi:hypothetical protein